VERRRSGEEEKWRGGEEDVPLYLLNMGNTLPSKHR
jgi:hypothetical protein